MKNILNKILKEEKLSKKLVKIKTKEEVYNFFKEIDSNLSIEDYEEGIKEIMNIKLNDISNSHALESISGGKSSLSKAVLSSTLASILAVNSSSINSNASATDVKKYIPPVLAGVAAGGMFGTLGVAALYCFGGQIYNKAAENKALSASTITLSAIKDYEKINSNIIENLKNSILGQELSNPAKESIIKFYEDDNLPSFKVSLLSYCLYDIIKQYNTNPKNQKYNTFKEILESEIHKMSSNQQAYFKSIGSNKNKFLYDLSFLNANFKLEFYQQFIYKTVPELNPYQPNSNLPEGTEFHGIYNCGKNNCFFNATLQLIYLMPEFRNNTINNEYLKNLATSIHKKSDPIYNEQLQKVTNDIDSELNKIIQSLNSNHIFEYLKEYDLSKMKTNSGEQPSDIEKYEKLQNDLKYANTNDDLKNIVRNNKFLISNYLVGKGYSNIFESFYEKILEKGSIEAFYNSVNTNNTNIDNFNTIYPTLQNLLARIKSGKSNTYEFGNDVTEFSKTLSIGNRNKNQTSQEDANDVLTSFEIPEYLLHNIFSLKGCSNNISNEEFYAYIKYNLDLWAPYSKYLTITTQIHVYEPQKSFSVPLNYTTKDGRSLQLMGICCHSGNLYSGHYWTISKSKDGRWVKCNDSSIQSNLSYSDVKDDINKGYIYLYGPADDNN